MTVRELINRLLDNPPDAEVVVDESRQLRVSFGLTFRDLPKGKSQQIPTVFIETR
jgi:hypothetical protein